MKKQNEIKLSEKLRNWCEKTTFHAVPNIATNEQVPLKIMWSICLIASVGYCCRILTSSIIDYYEYRVLTTFEIVQESTTYFPAITLCNLNEFDLSKNKNLSDLARSLSESSTNSNLDPKARLEEIKKEFLKINDSSLLEKSRFTLKDMLVSCNYNELKCNEKDFRLVKNELYGNCYLFNSNNSQSVLSTSKYGPKYGLQLELFIGLEESSSPMSATQGAILFINNQTNLVRITDPGIELSPGTQTNLAINRMFTYKLPYPYSKCIDQNNFDFLTEKSELNLVKLTIEFTNKYSQSYCIELCFQEYLIGKCNCFEWEFIGDLFNLNNSIEICSNKSLTEIYCLNLAKKKFYNGYFNENCKNSCPIECERVTYKIASLSTADFPSLFYERILLNNSFIRRKFRIENSFNKEKSFYEEFRNSLLSVNVYYDSDTYEKITETPETNFATLLANLGGQFGLFRYFIFLININY